MKMDAGIVDTVYILVSDKVHHRDSGTGEVYATSSDITQGDKNIREEWLGYWQKLNKTIDGWQAMHMKVVNVDDVFTADYVANLET
ncbi:MAG: hypothetical protein GY936_20670, partial [Ignavibacteriae bacterium]|nr:hypothetical protein [Ignavibacteriota bacterium]